MAKELTTLPTVEVKSINWTLNQARTVEFEETCLVENRLLVNGDELVYTDPDAGEIFRGWVNAEKGKKAQGDEGGAGNAADLGRFLAKQRAYLICPNACPPMGAPGTSKFRIVSGTTVSDAIIAVLKYAGPVSGGGLGVLGTTNINATLGNLTLNTDIDKGGMSMADWINSILEQTPGGVWFTKGSDFYAIDFYAQGVCPLVEADFDVATPDPRSNNLMQSWEVGESTDAKFRGVVVEGTGQFTRRILQNFSGPSCAPRAGELVYQMGSAGANTGTEVASNIWTFGYRWYLPENVCLDNYFDSNGNPTNGVFLSYKADYTSGASPITDQQKDLNVQLFADTDPFAFDVGPSGTLRGVYSGTLTYIANDVVNYNGTWYKCTVTNIATLPTNESFWALYVGVNPRLGRFYVGHGILFGNVGRPSPPAFDSGVGFKVRYTSYDGPFVVARYSTDPKLLREGDFPVQREDLCKYTQPETRSPFSQIVPGHEGDLPTPPTYFPIVERAIAYDPTVEMQAVCDCLFPSKTGTHYTGTIPIHISPRLKDVVLGQYVAKFGTDCRIRSVKIDPVARTASLEVSGLALRDSTIALNLLSQQRAAKNGNWSDRKVLKCLNGQIAGQLPSIVLKGNCQPLAEATTNVKKAGCTFALSSGT